jgi:hypothetical protein
MPGFVRLIGSLLLAAGSFGFTGSAATSIGVFFGQPPPNPTSSGSSVRFRT